MRNVNQIKWYVGKVTMFLAVCVIIVNILLLVAKKNYTKFSEIQEEEVYKKIENVYELVKDQLRIIVDELNNDSLLKDKEYYIVFDADLLSGKPLKKK